MMREAVGAALLAALTLDLCSPAALAETPDRSVMIGVPPPRLRDLLASEFELEGCRIRLAGARADVTICEDHAADREAIYRAALDAERKAATPPPPSSWSWESFAWGAGVTAVVGVVVAVAAAVR